MRGVWVCHKLLLSQTGSKTKRVSPQLSDSGCGRGVSDTLTQTQSDWSSLLRVTVNNCELRLNSSKAIHTHHGFSFKNIKIQSACSQPNLSNSNFNDVLIITPKDWFCWYYANQVRNQTFNLYLWSRAANLLALKCMTPSKLAFFGQIQAYLFSERPIYQTKKDLE